jgi:pimeloyl-ACP methyl ester carboxylesterase
MPSRPSMKCEDGKSEAQTLMFPSRSTYHTITSTTSAFPYLLPHLSIPPLLNTTSTRTFSTVINSASMTKSNIPSTTLQPQTILFIHGALSSHQEYRFVSHSRHLQGYHILIPSLHSSGPDTSLGVRPFTLERVATLLAHLVHTQSPDGRAHIVGVSLGAHVAVALASLFPDVLQDGSMFVSGYNRFETPAMLRPIVPYFFYALMKGPILLPKRLVRWAMDGADVKGVDARTGNEVTVEEREVGGVCNLDCKSRSFSDFFALGVLTRKRLRHSDVSCSALVWSLQAG